MKKLILFFLSFISCYSFAFNENDLVTLLQQPSHIQGEFIQNRYLKNLTQPITTSGKFNLDIQQGLLWHMEQPFNTQLKVTKNGIMQWNGQQWVSNNNLTQKEQINLFLGLLSGDLTPLKNQFSLSLSGTEKHWQLTLQPNSLIMRQIFQHIVIQGDNYVREINLQETQGDNTQILFNHIVAN